MTRYHLQAPLAVTAGENPLAPHLLPVNHILANAPAPPNAGAGVDLRRVELLGQIRQASEAIGREFRDDIYATHEVGELEMELEVLKETKLSNDIKALCEANGLHFNSLAFDGLSFAELQEQQLKYIRIVEYKGLCEIRDHRFPEEFLTRPETTTANVKEMIDNSRAAYLDLINLQQLLNAGDEVEEMAIDVAPADEAAPVGRGAYYALGSACCVLALVAGLVLYAVNDAE